MLLIKDGTDDVVVAGGSGAQEGVGAVTLLEPADQQADPTLFSTFLMGLLAEPERDEPGFIEKAMATPAVRSFLRAPPGGRSPAGSSGRPGAGTERSS